VDVHFSTNVSTVLVLIPDLFAPDGWTTELEKLGMTVIAARGVRDGLARVREGGIDAIVIDVIIPDNGVRDFVTELNRLPDAPPFILVSSSPKAPEVSARLGAAAFLPKPCSADDLVDAIGRVNARRLDDEPTQPRRSFSE
jgi:DNA-binding NtrC family response regulator